MHAFAEFVHELSVKAFRGGVVESQVQHVVARLNSFRPEKISVVVVARKCVQGVRLIEINTCLRRGVASIAVGGRTSIAGLRVS